MPKGLVERLAAEKIFVASRLGRLRISPHVFNDEGDIERFLKAFKKQMSSL
jgi:selenocysteine lyase/cysteine desulfurase